MTTPTRQGPPAWVFHLVLWLPVTTLVAGLVLRRFESPDAASAARALLSLTVLLWVGTAVVALIKGERPWGRGPFSLPGLLTVLLPALLIALGVYVRS